MKKTLLNVLVAFCVILLPLSAQAANLHTILIADTLDYNLGAQVALDIRNMREVMQKAASHTGLEYKETSIQGDNVKPEIVLQKLDSLEVEKDDTVVFYFSGHGFRTPSKWQSPWPNLYFSEENKGVDLELVLEKLEKQNPRFLLVITDVCNSLVAETQIQLVTKAFRSFNIPIKDLSQGYKKLFLEAEGVVMVTSSEAGEPSWSTDSGGIFTNALIKALNSALRTDDNPEWNKILETASDNVIFYSQHPDYRIFLNGA